MFVNSKLDNSIEVCVVKYSMHFHHELKGDHVSKTK